MTTREVPRSDWKTTLACVCEEEITRHVTVDVISPELGNQRLVTFLPLIGLEVNQHGESPESIAITTTPAVDRTDDAPFTHTVDHPTHIWVKEDESGRLEAVDIESEDATKTLLRFDDEARTGGEEESETGLW